MRTVFVNPRRRSKRRSKKANPRKARRSAKRSVRKTNPRRRKASKMVMNPRRRRRSARRRRNPMAPFVRSLNNPLILKNPRALRRRRRNPDGLKLNLKSILDKTLSYGGGSALGVGVNIIALNKIDNKWMRNGARLGVAILGGGFLKGDLGAAAAGAVLAPMWQEIAIMLSLTGDESASSAQPSEASLDLLSADLQDVLDEAAVNEIYDAYN